MKSKNTILMGILGALFLCVAGMFFYENFYKEHSEDKKLTPVLAVKKDIPAGTAISQDNVGFIKINKESVTDTNVTDYEEVAGKTSATDMFKGEMISNKRIAKEDDAEGKYRLTISQSNAIAENEIEKGDTIRVFVKPNHMSQLFEVLKAKDVDAVATRKTNSGKETGQVSGFKTLANDKEIELYERASSVGDIVVIAYEDLSKADEAEILSYEESQVLIEQVSEYAREEGKGKSYFGHIHQVTKGDTWKSLGVEYKTNEAFLKELNPSVELLKEDIFIRVN